jgi:hypothetical protein
MDGEYEGTMEEENKKAKNKSISNFIKISRSTSKNNFYDFMTSFKHFIFNCIRNIFQAIPFPSLLFQHFA